MSEYYSQADEAEVDELKKNDAEYNPSSDHQESESSGEPAKKEKKTRKAAGKKSDKKDKNAPKKALSGYMIFSNENREIVKKEQPQLAAKEIMSELGARWKNMDAEAKKQYNDKAEEDKKRYQKEKEAYEKSGKTPKDEVADKKKPEAKTADAEGKSKATKKKAESSILDTAAKKKQKTLHPKKVEE